jgi:hypothetical protein
MKAMAMRLKMGTMRVKLPNMDRNLSFGDGSRA